MLHAVEIALSDFGLDFRRLGAHELVDFRLPGGCRRRLIGVPLMVRRGTEPDVHLRARIQVQIGQTQQARFVIEGLGDALDQGGKVQRNHVQMNADGQQVLLDHGCDSLAVAVPGIGDEGELHRVPFAVVQLAAAETKSVALQAAARGGPIERMRLQRGVEPELVGGRYGPLGRPGVAAVDYAAQVRAVDGLGHGAPEGGGSKPGLLVGRERRGGGLVEPHHLRFQRGPGIQHRTGRQFRQIVECVGVHRIDQIDLSAAKLDQLDVPVLLNLQADPVDVGQADAVRVHLPVVQVPRKLDLDSGLVLRHHIRSQNRRRLPRRFRRHHGHLVEQPFQTRHRSSEQHRDRQRR